MKLISEWYVKPKYEVEAAKERIYLTPTEIIILTIPPIQRGMLYTLTQPNDSSTITNLLVNLKHSLSIALVHFYPLAGRFTTETFPNEHACTVFIDCNKGPGARLTHVVASDLTIVDVVSQIYVPDIVKKFFDLGEESINVEGHSRPLLSIQVTELIDGIFIGFTMNHSVADGTSFMHFASMLSEIYCSDNSLFEISRVPVIVHEHAKPPIKLPYLGLEEIIIRSKTEPLIDRVFHFSSKSIAMIKAKANNQVNNTQQLSSFQSLVSLIWRSITKARNLSSDEETTCSLVINARTRLAPLSNNSFGNYISLCEVISKVGELFDHDIGWTASRLNDAIKAQDTNSIDSVWKKFAKLILSPGFLSFIKNHGANGVVIGGSARFDMYGLDFGLGKAVYVFMNSGYKKDGKMKASQGCEGVGSVDIEICLKEEHMVALEADREFMSFVS